MKNKVDAKKLLDCIGQVGDDLILESETAKLNAGRRFSRHFLSAAAIVVLGLVIGGVYFMYPGLRRTMEYADTAAGMPATVTAPADAPPAPAAAPPAVPGAADVGGGEVAEETQVMPDEGRVTWSLPAPVPGDESDEVPRNFEFGQRVGIPCPLCGEYEWSIFCFYGYEEGQRRQERSTAPIWVSVTDIVNEYVREPYHTFDLMQLPQFTAWGDVPSNARLVFRTDATVYDVHIMGLDYKFIVEQVFHRAMYFPFLEVWHPGEALVLSSFTWMTHIPWFGISYRCEAGERHYITAMNNFRGGCTPDILPQTIRPENIIMADAPGADEMRIHQPYDIPLINLLLGNYTPGAIYSRFIDTNVDNHFVYYRRLYYDGRVNFYFQIDGIMESGFYDFRFVFATEEAQSLIPRENPDSTMNWHIAFPAHYFNTETGDALFIYAPTADASWLFIDIGPPFWWGWADNVEDFRLYVTLLLPR